MTRDETSFWSSVPDDPALRAQAREGFPVRSLVVDGLPRRPNREIDAAQASSFASRGLRCFVLTATVCAELTAEQLRDLLMLYRDDFADESASSGSEHRIYAYGRREKSGRDTRVVVAQMILWPERGRHRGREGV